MKERRSGSFSFHDLTQSTFSSWFLSPFLSQFLLSLSSSLGQTEKKDFYDLCWVWLSFDLWHVILLFFTRIDRCKTWSTKTSVPGYRKDHTTFFDNFFLFHSIPFRFSLSFCVLLLFLWETKFFFRFQNFSISPLSSNLLGFIDLTDIFGPGFQLLPNSTIHGSTTKADISLSLSLSLFSFYDCSAMIVKRNREWLSGRK